MFFDADDFVHCRIVEYCRRHPTECGWYVERGFVYDERTLLVSPLARFSEICGTSHILAYDLVEPTGILRTSSREEVLGALGQEYVSLILGAHPFMVEYFAKRGKRLAPLPFDGAVYVRGTGENDRRWFKAPGFPRPPSRRFCEEFGMNVSLADRLPAYARWPRAITAHVVQSLKGGSKVFDASARERERGRVLRLP